MKRTYITVNDYLFRLALVVNTSHSRFNDNLTSIIIYILYSQKEQTPVMNANEIAKAIHVSLDLEFTPKEIERCMRENSSQFACVDGCRFSLSPEGANKIHEEKQQEIDKKIKEYTEIYHISMSTDDVSKLLYSFLYDCLGRNISDLLSVIQGTGVSASDVNGIDRLSNDERKIINDFIEWDDREKNDLLFDLISFAVDFCRLTVKKDSNSFNTLLQGKIFFLDANIIFRLMGLNNRERQETVSNFLRKCINSNIKIRYTSQTQKEVLEAIHFHVRNVEKSLQSYRGKGKSVRKLYQLSNDEDGFLEAYFDWAGKTNGFGKFDDFEQSLKTLYYSSVSNYIQEEVINIIVTEDEIKSYFQAKNGQTNRSTAEYDIKNVKYIVQKRKNNNDSVGWNTKEYLISADHKLVEWSMNHVSAVNPVVVLPSVWYSTILKVSGRSDNDEKAFAEFIKIRYMQDHSVDNIKYLISNVCQKTSDGVLQDMLFDEISNNNEIINHLTNLTQNEIPVIVENTYENVLEKTKLEGYDSGIIKGQHQGYENGRQEGIELGVKIGRLKQQKEELKK